MRPANVLIAMISIFVAAILCGPLEFWQNILLACFSGGFITAGANAINDYFDVEIDRINKPRRPIPSGAVTPRQTVFFSGFLFAGGIFLGFCINWLALLISAISSIMLYIYSARLKGTVPFGNLTVSIATGLAFIYGGVAVGNVNNALFPAAFAFMMHFGREIIKDIEDVDGDKQHRAYTLPVRFGLVSAKWLVSVIFFLLILLTVIPFLLGIYGLWYFIIVMVGVNSILVFSTLYMWKKSEKRDFSTLSVLLKADMLMGLLAIYAGRW